MRPFKPTFVVKLQFNCLSSLDINLTIISSSYKHGYFSPDLPDFTKVKPIVKHRPTSYILVSESANLPRECMASIPSPVLFLLFNCFNCEDTDD